MGLNIFKESWRLFKRVEWGPDGCADGGWVFLDGFSIMWKGKVFIYRGWVISEMVESFVEGIV